MTIVMLNALDDSFWQSRQWQAAVTSGSCVTS